MLKVTITDDEKRTRLVVEGRLVAPETGELLRTWLCAREVAPLKSIEVDLSGVSFADRVATELLATMTRQNVRLIGRGAMTRSLIAQARGGADTPAGPADQGGRKR